MSYQFIVVHQFQLDAQSIDEFLLTNHDFVQDAQAKNIILDPGQAFGTGEHASTKLCLLLLHGCITGGECVLDYGTGTGILAIAALKVFN